MPEFSRADLILIAIIFIFTYAISYGILVLFIG